MALAQIAVTLGVLLWLVHLFGVGAVTTAAVVITPSTVAAAVVLGLVGGAAQGLRWRAVSAGLGDRMTAGHAVARCCEAACLNAVLPGGVAGDVVRAMRRSHGGAGWVGVGSVVGERLCGTVVVLLAAAPAAWSLGARTGVAASLAMGAVAIAGLVAVAAARSMRRWPWRAVVACIIWSVVGWLAFLGLFLVATGALAAAGAGPGLTSTRAAALGSLTLAGMSVPLNVGGWGPREGVAAYAYALAGLPPEHGLTASVAYGILALISTLPGAVLLVIGAAPRLRRPTRA